MSFEEPGSPTDDVVAGDPFLTAPSDFEAPAVPAPGRAVPEPEPVPTPIAVAPPAQAVTLATDSVEPRNEPAKRSDTESNSGKVKAAAVLAAAAALTNKVRQKAPEMLRDIRDKRAAGKCVLITERDGVKVAVGPFADKSNAEMNASKVAGVATVVPLISEDAFHNT